MAAAASTRGRRVCDGPQAAMQGLCCGTLGSAAGGGGGGGGGGEGAGIGGQAGVGEGCRVEVGCSRSQGLSRQAPDQIRSDQTRHEQEWRGWTTSALLTC
jgi:hypothetical protein